MNIRITIDKLDHFGRGIGYYNGKVIFVPNCLPGSIVEIEIIEDKKKYSVGKVLKYIEKSSKQISSPCPYYDKCGGCQIGHMKYCDQLNYKKEKLSEILRNYTGINHSIEVIASDNDYNYRNKITLKIENGKWGYYHENTHDFIEIKKCLLASESINKVIQNKDVFNILSGEISIRSNYNNEILIHIKSEKKVKIDIDVIKREVKLIVIILNDKIIYGDDKFIEIISNKLFTVHYDAFFQVNLNMLSKVFNILNLKNYGNIIDLYCGVGTLGLAVNYNKLYGIEINESSIKDAITNTKMNKQENAFFILGDSSKILNINDKIDTLFIDPPRSGINKKTMKNIMDMEIDEIIYVSCNPMTLTRDLNILKNKYEVNKIYLLDMFPNTYHVETVCLMSINR